jgi:LuxR family maltose regulon positive regulatory protein
MRLSREIGFTLRYLHAVNKLAYVYKTTGQLRRSYQLLNETLSFIQEKGTSGYFAAGILYCRLVDLLYEWNRLAEARHLIDDHLKPEMVAELPYLLVDHCNVQARDLLMKHDFAGSQNALHKAVALTQQSYIWPGLTWQTESLQIQLWLKTGEISLAEAWASEQLKKLADSKKSAKVLAFSTESDVFSIVSVHLARGTYHDALPLLDQMNESAIAGERKASLIKIFTLKAIALQFTGESEQAIAALKSALALAEPEGYVRTFLDEGEPIAALLAIIVNENRSPHLEYAARLLKAFEEEQRSAGQLTPVEGHLQGQGRQKTDAIIEPLSRRELEVLRCMAAGLSNNETAHQLVIEISTVKRHINNIFAKLGVENRVQALNKAKEFDLL